MSKWTLFSNHGHVLLYLANDPEARLRDVAAAVGITERAVQKIVRDLQDGRVLSVTKHGRRNKYRIHTRKPLRHKLESHRTVGSLVKLISKESKPEKRKAVVTKPPVIEDKPPWVDETPVSQLEPESKPDPVPVPESKPEPEPLPNSEPTPETPPVASEAPEPPAEAIPDVEIPPEPKAPEPPRVRKARKPAKKKTPADDQQGSLF